MKKAFIKLEEHTLATKNNKNVAIYQCIMYSDENCVEWLGSSEYYSNKAEALQDTLSQSKASNLEVINLNGEN